jgi:hypothetical protein
VDVAEDLEETIESLIVDVRILIVGQYRRNTMNYVKFIKGLLIPKALILRRAEEAAEHARMNACHSGPQDCYIMTVKSRIGSQTFAGGYNDLLDMERAYKAVLDEYGISSETSKRID